MQLRNHQLMLSGGVSKWPPKWTQAGGPLKASVSGEVGVLDGVSLSKILADTLYLQMHTEEGDYIGMLVFESAADAKEVSKFLSKHVNRPIQEIGAMEFP
ncbi:MAG TPA: hypothetical protein VGH22_21220 [Candidatus Binatia bacterium]|jgi:hypothetical protein